MYVCRTKSNLGEQYYRNTNIKTIFLSAVRWSKHAFFYNLRFNTRLNYGKRVEICILLVKYTCVNREAFDKCQQHCHIPLDGGPGCPIRGACTSLSVGYTCFPKVNAFACNNIARNVIGFSTVCLYYGRVYRICAQQRCCTRHDERSQTEKKCVLSTTNIKKKNN